MFGEAATDPIDEQGQPEIESDGGVAVEQVVVRRRDVLRCGIGGDRRAGERAEFGELET